MPPSQGGNGNLSDLIYVSPTRDEGFYELALAHEFQHLINFNQHVLIRGGAGEEPWLNEGLSHVCEDLIGQHEHNRSYMDIFLSAPHSYSLISSPMSSDGVRGAAYLFVRSLIEEFGSDILSRLVQTDQAGIANVEHATGQPFADLFDRHVSRVFLSGSGLNGTLNYTTPFLADATTGVRLFPLPQEFVVSPQSASVGEGIKPVSAAYLRLMGNGRHTITIQTDAEGDFRAQLIPIPNYELRIVVPTDFFSGITLDAALAGPFFSYQPIHFTGTVSDPSVSEILFFFIHSDRDKNMGFISSVTNGRFSHTFFFSPEQIGEYQFQIETRHAGQPWSSAGLFSPFTIREGQGTAPIPVDFFSDITFSAPLPVEYATGQAIRMTGTVSDPLISEISLGFWHEDNTKTVVFSAPVRNGKFSKTLFFAHKQTGEYSFQIAKGDEQTTTVSSADVFSPVIIRKGEGVDQLPVDFFDGITLASPLPVEYVTGQPIRIAGTVSDPSVSQIEFTFIIFSWEGLQGSFEGYLNLFAPVTDGQFNRTLYFSHREATGDYTLDIFLWREDDRSWKGRRFQPIAVGKGPGVIPIPVDFFDGITFAAPLPVEYTIGQITRIAGAVSDPSVSDINFRFRPIDDPAKSVNLRVPVTNGQFSTTLRLSPEQPVGENYEVGIFTRKKGSRPGGAWPWVGSFSPITVKASPDYDGEGTDLPVSITLETTHAGPFFSYQPIHITGTVSDSSVSELRFKFIRGDSDRRLWSRCPVIDGRFSHRLFFSHEQAGEYQIEIWTQPVPEKVGTNYPLRIEKGEGTAPVPVDFFDDITFSSPIPLEYTTGQAVRIAGTVSDPSAFRIDLTFWEYVEKVEGQGYYRTAMGFRAPVTNGRFSKTFLFSDEQAGEYQFRVEMWRASNRSLPWYLEGIFSPITVKEAPSPDFDGNGTVGFTDFIAFAGAFGKSSVDEDFDARFDLDGDGTVGFTDFIAFAAAFGRPLQN